MSSVGAVSAATVSTANYVAQQAAYPTRQAEKHGDEADGAKDARARDAAATPHKLNVKA